MIDVLAIDYPYDCNQYLNELQAYNTNRGTDELLDLMREIQKSGNYYWEGLVFPSIESFDIPALGTLNGITNIAPGSYVTAISAYSALGAGFVFKLYDKGSKASVFYSDYAQQDVVAGKFGVIEDVPTGRRCC